MAENMTKDIWNDDDGAKEPPKKRRMLRKFLIFLLVLIAVLGLVLVAAWRDGTGFDALRRYFAYGTEAVGGEKTVYRYDTDNTNRFARVGTGSLVILSDTSLRLLGPDGSEGWSANVKMNAPGLGQGGGLAVAYDIGGTTLCVADFKGSKTDIEPAGEIISADLSDSGYLAVCSDAAGYKGAVTVYDTSGKAVYVWYSGTGYLVRAAVSPDGKYLAVLCLQDSGSVVHTFALTSADERGSAACADELFADLFWRGGKVCCVSQMRLAFFDDAARLTAEYPFGDLYLYDYAAEGDGFVTLALSRYRSGSAEQLVTVGASGNELGKCSTTGAVTSLSVNGKQVLVQYSDRLTLYNQQLDEIKSVEQNLLGVRRSVLLRRGAALLVSGSSAEVLAF